MATPDLEEEVKCLKDQLKGIMEKNNDLVQQAQFWKMRAGQLQNEKLDIIKENNELKLKLSRMRSASAAQARALDATTEATMSHLVQASGAFARTVELVKSHITQIEELEAVLPRWSTLGATPITDKVHKVPPMMMGGRSIQPFVSLNRVPMNSSGTSRSPNQNRNVSERVLPLPMHMLQDVYIPLRRIDTSEFTNNVSPEMEPEVDMPEENMMMEDGSEHDMEESRNYSEEVVEMRQLSILHEEPSEQHNETTSPTLPVNRLELENPLEGPSWLLDNLDRSRTPRFQTNVTTRGGKGRGRVLEADSTTELDESRTYTPLPAPPPAPAPAPHSPPQSENIPPPGEGNPEERHVFTPTRRRRRRKRSASPPALVLPSASPRHAPPARTPPRSPLLPSPTHYRNNNKSHRSERVLKVLVPKISLEAMEGGGGGAGAVVYHTTPKRQMRFDAPSPNGATDAAVIVMEQRQDRTQSNYEGDASNSSAQRSSNVAVRGGRSVGDSVGEGNNDSGAETRTRRPRKQVTYKEKPLNRKLRR